jgi:hypothetical protein
MNANVVKSLRMSGAVISPSARRFAANAAKGTGQKVHPLLWFVPPALVAFGYGGVVVASDTGSLHRILASFGKVPKE